MDELRLILIIAGILLIGLIYLFSRRSQQNGKPSAEEPHVEETEWMEEIARQRRKLAETRTQPAMDDDEAHVPVLDEVVTLPPETVVEDHQPSSTGSGSVSESAGEEAARPAEPVTEPTGDAPPSEPAVLEPEEPTGETATPEGEEADTAALEGEETDTAAPEELILVLHVTAPADMVFVGANLFSALEEVGLRFGDGGIFHYYREQEDQGPALFSVANILEPGTFEPGEPGETFTTPGIVLFMRAPGPLSARETIETMLLKSQQLAQSLGGEIRDQERKPLTEATIQSLLDQAAAFDRAAKRQTE